MITNSLKIIKPEQIDDKNTTFQICSSDNISELIQSIKKMGILSPLLVQPISDNNFRIVSGFSRFKAVKTLGIQNIPVFIKTTPDDLELFKIAIQEQSVTKQLDAIQISFVIKKLEQGFNLLPEQIIHDFFPLMKLGRNPKVYQLHQPLHLLIPEWQKSLINDNISLDLAATFSDFEDKIQAAVYKFFTELRLGKNQQKDFWMLISDVSRIKGMTICEFLDEPNFQDILNQDKWTPAQKAEHCKQLLFSWRYPEFSKTKEKYETLLSEAKLPPEIRVQAPPSFEGNSFNVFFSFKNLQEYQNHLNTLQSMQDKHIIEKMLELV